MNYNYKFRILSVVLFCGVLFHGVMGVRLAGTCLANEQKSELEAADKAREQGRYEEALEQLKAVRKEKGNHVSVLWRWAWTLSDMGEVKEGKTREMLFSKAWRKAKAAVAADPDNGRAHMVAAIVAGRKALISPTRQQVELSRKVKEHADRAIALDSTLAPAYHARGIWHREVAVLGGFTRLILRTVYGGLPEASLEKALADLRKSIQLDDQIPDRVELGLVYWEMGKKGKARTQWRKALKMPRVMHLDKYHQLRAAKLLKRN